MIENVKIKMQSFNIKFKIIFLAIFLFGTFGLAESSWGAGEQVTFFQLTSTITGTFPFTVGLGFKKGDVSNSFTLDITDYQVVVKKYWNDGSVKHAIVSGKVALTANMAKTINVLKAGTAPIGVNLTATDIQVANPSASVQLGSIGTVNLSSLLASPFRTWISGPEMVEAHYRSQVGSDPSLVVWFYVRFYKGGQIWIRTVAENGYLDISTNNKTYVPIVIIGGTTIYNNGGVSLSHYAHTRWTTEGWIGISDPQIMAKLDTNYLEDAKLVPNYFDKTPSAATLNGLYQSYSPMQQGGWTQNMGEAGFQDQIGLLPLWDALYISSGGDARAYKSVLANAKALNSYAIVWNDSVTKLPMKPSDRPTWSFDGPNQGGGNPPSAGSLQWEVAHHGSGGYLAYILTGDYYYLETMENQAANIYLGAGSVNWATDPPSNNYGTSRIINGQTRGYAWFFRTLSQLAGIAPSGDTIVADYASLLGNNIANFKSIKDTVNPPGIGYLYEYNASLYGPGLVAPWQQHFFIQSLGMGSDIEPLTNMAAYNDVRDYMYRASAGILGNSSGYCFTEASQYNIKSNDGTSGSPNGWYKTWAGVYQGTFTIPSACGNTLNGSSGGAPSVASTGYWGNLLPAIAYAVDHGAPGASAAWTRLTSANNWSTVENSGFSDAPIWGIVPRVSISSDTVPPAAPQGLIIQ